MYWRILLISSLLWLPSGNTEAAALSAAHLRCTQLFLKSRSLEATLLWGPFTGPLLVSPTEPVTGQQLLESPLYTNLHPLVSGSLTGSRGPLSGVDIVRSKPESMANSFGDHMFFDRDGGLWAHIGAVGEYYPKPVDAVSEGVARFRFLETLFRVERLKQGHGEVGLDTVYPRFMGGQYSYFHFPVIKGERASEFVAYDVYGTYLRHQRGDFYRIGYREEIYRDYLEFVLLQYRERLSISAKQVETLRMISQALYGRTTVVVQEPVGRQAGEMAFNTGVFGVHSKNKRERVPIEILHELDLRTVIGAAESSYIVEVGRHIRVKGDRVADPQFVLKILLSIIAGKSDVDYIVIEADKIRKRMWGQLGFSSVEISSHRAGEYYESGTDYIMYATVDTIVQAMLSAH